MARILIGIGSALALAACATHVPASRMNTRVLVQRTPTLAEPVQGVHVVMTCPDGTQRDLGVTGIDGTLAISPSTAPALDCKLNVAGTNFRGESRTVESVCTTRAGNVCTGLNATILLQPTGSAGF